MTGITLAQYRIDAELGRGSMGAAWRTDNVLLYTSNTDSSLWSVGIDGGQTEGEIMVRPFDPGSRRFTGDETPAGLGEQSCRSVAVSGEGTAVIGAEADPQRRSLFWLSADGAVLEALADPPVSIDESSAPRSAERMSISPDACWLATVVRTTSGSDVYLQDLKGGAPRRLTLTERAFHPTISPDGRWIYYAEQSDSVLVIMRKRADQSGGAEFTGVSGPWPDVSADGSRLLAMSEWWEPGRVFDLEASAMPSAGIPVPGTQDDREGAISPDGRFLATDGPDGILVREVGGTAVFQVALGLPSQSRPRWSRDGRHLYFASRVSLFRIPVTLSPIFDYGQPERVADDLGGLFRFDLHPGGERILVWGQLPGSGNDAPSLRIVFNWFTRLRAIAPVGRG